jgi:hypothetical protein
VLDDVSRDEVQALLGTDDSFELGPLALEALYALGVLAFSNFLEVGVEGSAPDLVQVQLSEAALVEDRYRRPVLDGALNVVDADVVAEDRACSCR